MSVLLIFNFLYMQCTSLFNLPVIIAIAGSLGGPTPYLLIAVTMTTKVPVNTPSGSDGAVTVSVVVELLTFIIVPL